MHYFLLFLNKQVFLFLNTYPDFSFEMIEMKKNHPLNHFMTSFFLWSFST